MSDRRHRLLELLRERSFRQGRFTLASGAESDFFIDVKQTALLAEGHELCGHVLFDELRELRQHTAEPLAAVAGVELGGCPLASAVAVVSWQAAKPLDALYVRKAAKDHGTKRLVEGAAHLRAGARVVLLEDVVTTGGSTLRAAATLGEAGYDVVAVIALVDRLEGGREAIERAGLRVRSVFTRLDFIPDSL